MPSGSSDPLPAHDRTGAFAVESTAALDGALAQRITRLCEDCRQVDGVDPLNEVARMNVTDGTVRDGVAHVLVRDGDELIAYAQLDSSMSDGVAIAPTVAQLMVAPQHRRRGAAWALLGSLGFDLRPDADRRHNERHRQGQRISLWSFGDLPAARAWAEKYQMARVRELLVMSRPAPDVPAAAIPEGYTVRPFTEHDLSDLLSVNSTAFAHHPEQGQMSAEDVHARMSESWFDPEGFLVLEHEGHVVGFHWTKQHSPSLGEVYVIAVHPDHGGRGLGRQLLHAGMTHLADRGVEEIILYVEGDEAGPVGLYRTTGFEVTNVDALYTTVPGARP